MTPSESRQEAAVGFTEKLPTGKFRARWFDPSGAQRSKSFARERDAVRFLRNIESDIDRGTYADDKAAKITFGEWAEHCMALDAKRLARTTHARDRSYLDNHVLPRWRAVRLDRITRTEVERWIAELSDDEASVRRAGGSLAPGTVEKIYQVFRKIIGAAVREGRLPRSPCPEHPPIPRQKRKVVRFLDEDQVAHLATTIDQRYEAMMYVGAYGGFRIGELCALRTDDVDFDRGTIRVDEGITDVGGTIQFEDPKTARAFRTVPIADIALDHLRGHLKTHVAGGRRALLFTSLNGNVIRPSNWRRRYFNPAARDADLEPLTPHDLRHTAASLFIAAGASPWMLAEILGHTDTRMVDRVYGHLFDRDREALRQRISANARTPKSSGADVA